MSRCNDLWRCITSPSNAEEHFASLPAFGAGRRRLSRRRLPACSRRRRAPNVLIRAPLAPSLRFIGTCAGILASSAGLLQDNGGQMPDAAHIALGFGRRFCCFWLFCPWQSGVQAPELSPASCQCREAAQQQRALVTTPWTLGEPRAHRLSLPLWGLSLQLRLLCSLWARVRSSAAPAALARRRSCFACAAAPVSSLHPSARQDVPFSVRSTVQGAS